MRDSVTENKCLKEGEGEGKPNPKQKRTSDSEDPESPAKKSKTENEKNPEVVGSDEAGSEVENGKFVAGEMGFEIETDAAEDKGSRHSMEDAWVVLLDAALDYPTKLRCAHFAIYDGHGGRLSAEHAQKHLHANALSAGLPRGWQDGATAVCVWVVGKTVFVANIGDAKAVVARACTSDGLQNNPDGATPIKAIVLTREHKAIYPQERARYQKYFMRKGVACNNLAFLAGGTVSANGRLQGRLEVSRAFGDHQFKKVFGPSDAVDFVQKLPKVKG